MDKIVIKKAADCFRTDEKTIVTFCNDFFFQHLMFMKH